MFETQSLLHMICPGLAFLAFCNLISLMFCDMKKGYLKKEKEINSFAVFCLMWIMCFWVKTAVTWLPPFSHAGLIPHWATPLTLLFAAVTHTYFWCYKSSPADYNWLVKITPLTSPPWVTVKCTEGLNDVHRLLRMWSWAVQETWESSFLLCKKGACCTAIRWTDGRAGKQSRFINARELFWNVKYILCC